MNNLKSDAQSGGVDASQSRTLEEVQRIEAAKAALKTRLERGEIDGVEYNRQIIALTVPEEEKSKLPKHKRRGSILWLILLLVVAAIPAAIYMNWRFYFQNTLTAGPAQIIQENEEFVAPENPVQMAAEGVESGEYKGRPISIQYKAYYEISGVVTSVHDYWGFDDYDTLVPRDVCMAWGNLEAIYPNPDLEFSQEGRFCHVKFKGSSLEGLDVTYSRGPYGNLRLGISEMSNNHLISSTVEIRNQILGLGTGDKVKITGYLVNVWYGDLVLRSSMTRDDTGDGACEVIYVANIEKE